MKKAVEKERIRVIYKKMVDDGFTTLDLKSDYECRPYPITCRYKLSCCDGTHQEIQLVNGEWEGKHAVLLWSIMDGKYVEDFIGYLWKNQNWWENLLSDDVMKRAQAIIEDIVKGGREGLEKRINAEGIENMHSLVLTENYIKEIIRLPYSCAISFHGEVIAGVEEIEEYCKNQKESSSPYILKKFHYIALEKNETKESESVRCTNYLICKDAETAKTWIKEFVGMVNFSIYSKCIPNSWHRPPVICYTEGKRYMLLDYRKGYRE